MPHTINYKTISLTRVLLLATYFLLTIICSNLQLVATQQDDEFTPNLNNTKFEGIFNTNQNSQDSEDMHELPRCQQMNIPFCDGLPYNQTILPNFLGHQTQQEVIHEINMYHPLMRVNCSPDLKIFLCSVYAPMCFEHDNGSKPLHLAPCRSLCESARLGCSVPFKQFESDWPKSLDCNKFPEKLKGDTNVLCVGKEDDGMPYSTHRSDSSEYNPNSPVPREIGFVCPKNFELNSYTFHLNGRVYNNCAMPCEEVLVDKKNAQIVRLTTGVFAVICLLATLFTCANFLMDTKKFQYPSRPIIIISFCQLVVASCYIIGFLTNNSIACNDPTEPPKSLPNMKMIRTTTIGNKKGICTLQFMALYFFQISTTLWWVMLTLSWYMIARLKWAPEAVGSVAKYFHLFTWTTAALLTIYLSVLGNIEGDSMTGTCYVSSINQESINSFVIYPIYVSLGVGLFFFLLGSKSLLNSKEMLRREYGKQTEEHNSLIMRLGLYNLLFISFSVIFIGCHLYEQKNLNTWMFSWLSKICKDRDYSIPCPRHFIDQSPNYFTFVLKHMAALSIGIISSLFMISEVNFDPR